MSKSGETNSPEYTKWLEINQTMLDDLRGLLGIQEPERFTKFLDRVLNQKGEIRPESQEIEEDLIDLANKHEKFFNKWGLPGGGFAKTWGMLKISRGRLSEFSKKK